MNRLPAHRATTAHLQSLYPFVSDGGLGSDGPLIGRDLLGGAFCFDPWALYGQGRLTNPNVIVLGQLGRGKSTFVKSFVWRQVAFGRQAWIVDPKGEYGPLCEACGGAPVRMAPGGDLRLNPLELPLTGLAEVPAPRAVAARRSGLLGSLLVSALGRPLTPAERTAVDLAVIAAGGATTQPTLTDVVGALLDPGEAGARAVRTTPAALAADGRTPALELRRLVEGDLAGMFDGPTSVGLDLGAPVVTLDLSAVFGSPALPLLMTCATAWLQARLARPGGPRRLVVVDEAWAVLHDLSTARWLQSAFKLARAYGICNVAVVHRLSDLRAAGGSGTAQERLAEGLLADVETRVVFGQAPSEAEATAEMLDLSDTERDLVARLPRGIALWKVGERSFLVEHRVGRTEARLVDTDAAMAAGNPEEGGPGPGGWPGPVGAVDGPGDGEGPVPGDRDR